MVIKVYERRVNLLVETRAEVYLKSLVHATTMADTAVASQAPRPGLFGTKPAPAPTFDASEVQSDLNSLSTRLRVGEERYSDLRRKLAFIEQQSLAGQKKILSEFKHMTSEQTELKRSMVELQNRMVLLIKELQLMAKKSDVDVLRKYLDLWEPVKFVNADQVERMIKEALEYHERTTGREGQD